MSSDVAIVGAGVIGMSTAWHLAQHGVSCTVYDAMGIGAGMTGVQPGGVRTQWGSSLTCELALESRRFYDAIGDRLDPIKDPEFDACGYLFAASSEATLGALQRDVELQRSHGIASEILSPGQIGELVEGVDTDDLVGGAYCATDGYFNHPGAIVAAFAGAAERDGVMVLVRRVEAIEQAADAWTLRFADGSTATHSRVVVAAGAASSDLLRSIDAEVPVSAGRRYLFYSNPITPFLVRPLVVFTDEHFAVKHLSDGSVLASDLGLSTTGPAPEDAWRRQVTDTARRLVPLLEHVRYPVMVEGEYDVTPDQQPVLGPVPDRPGLHIAAGLNGRGMMLAPAIGRLVSAGVVGDDTGIPEDLAAGRFAHGEVRSGEARVI